MESSSKPPSKSLGWETREIESLVDAVATERAVGDAAVDPATDVIAMMSVKSVSIAAMTESMTGMVSVESAAGAVSAESAAA